MSKSFGRRLDVLYAMCGLNSVNGTGEYTCQPKIVFMRTYRRKQTGLSRCVIAHHAKKKKCKKGPYGDDAKPSFTQSTEHRFSLSHVTKTCSILSNVFNLCPAVEFFGTPLRVVKTKSVLQKISSLHISYHP